MHLWKRYEGICKPPERMADRKSIKPTNMNAMCLAKEIVPYIILGVCLVKAKELPGITIFLFSLCKAPVKCHARMPPPHFGSSEELVIKCTLSPRWTRPFHADSLIEHHTPCLKTHPCFWNTSTAEKPDFALEVGSLLIVEWRIFLRVSIFVQPINWNLDFGTMGLGRGCHWMVNSAAIKWITKTDSGSFPSRKWNHYNHRK